MANIKLVIITVIRFMNVRLDFNPFSFTILQALVALLVLGIIISFVRKLLS